MLSFGKKGSVASSVQLFKQVRHAPVAPEGVNTPFKVRTSASGRHVCLHDGELNLNAGPVRIEGKESPDDVVAGIMDIELVLSSWNRFDYKLVVIGGALECERVEVIFTDSCGHQYRIALHEETPMVHTIGFRYKVPSIRQIDIYQY